MSNRKHRWLGLGLVTTAGAGVIGLSAMMNPASAHADDIGLVMGGSELPIPGPQYVGAADGLYLNNPFTHLYPDLTFYQATPSNEFGNGLFTPEGLYPLFSGGVHQLYLNFPQDANGLPSLSTSVGQGAAIVESTVLSDEANGDASTVFGYSQSSTVASIAMKLLDPFGTPQTGPLDPQFLLLADPSNPNGGLLERFNGFETLSGATHVLPLSLPSLGLGFDGATPSDDFVTNIYSLEYDGFTDFPRYPINFLADLNAFLGIQTLHGTYLNGGIGGSGPTPEQIANAILLPGSEHSVTDPCAACLTDYHMINETAPLVALLPKQLQELLGPDLTYLINLGYGDGSLGYSVTADSPANVATPFGLFPNVSLSTVLSTLATDTQQGFQNLATNTDPYSAATEPATASTGSLTDLLSALSADAANPAASFTDFVNALSSAASTLYSTLLPTADIINALVTSFPAWDTSVFLDALSTGDLADALGLPIAATTAIGTLAAGFEVEIITTAIGQIQADFAGLF
jgi:hypothetical protein